MNNSHSDAAQLPFFKAHGTGNDFVVVDAVAQELQLDARQVAQLCDRHRGLGADGLLRIAHANEFGVEDANYFMDYRNADGSVAETCGNGLRVFARMLIDLGYEKRGQFTIGTRAGTVHATVTPEDTNFADVAIEMGQPNLALSTRRVIVTTEAGSWDGVPVFMPNPHCVTVVADVFSVGALLEAPTIDLVDSFPEGANVEFISGLDQNHITMRTYERGVGETLSCGSGACAAASVWAISQGLTAPWNIQVDVLGGTVHVDCSASGKVTLRGPAVVVATGTVLGHEWTS